MLRKGLLSLLIAASASSFASDTQDVIYKKDGSVLKGTLIEQDFQNGRYKIQLMGGSIFVVQKDDIDKITKEAKPVSTVEEELNAVAEESRAKLASPAPVETTASAFSSLPESNHMESKIGSVIYIGTLSHIVTVKLNDFYYGEDYESVATYNGIKIGYQKNYTKNIAVQYALNSGKLNKVELVDSDDYIVDEASGSELLDESYLGLSASVIASTNLQKGWQFYTGLGLLHDEYSNDFADATYTSLGLELGMGYSWQTLQVALQYQGVIAGDYPSELSVGHLNLQLGMNFK